MASISPSGRRTNQRLDAYTVLEQPTKITSFEPHLHAPGYRMCLEYIWGINVQTLSCAGYDHNWVRVYEYDRRLRASAAQRNHSAHHRLHGQHAGQQNVPDPSNWSGSGNRSISNMFIDLGQGVALTDEQFYAEMAQAPREAEAHSRRGAYRMPALQWRSHCAAAAEDWGPGGGGQ